MAYGVKPPTVSLESVLKLQANEQERLRRTDNTKVSEDVQVAVLHRIERLLAYILTEIEEPEAM
jgi:hypothetical protein